MTYGSLGNEFEQLVAAVLSAQGFLTELSTHSRSGPDRRIREIDIVARKDGSPIVKPVEVKITSRTRATLALLRDASSQTASLREFAVKSKPLLVIGAYVDHDRLRWAEEEFDIEIWDREILLRQAGAARTSAEEFFERMTDHFGTVLVADGSANLPAPDVLRIEQELSPPIEPLGESLIERLANVAAGKTQAKEYEKICQDIIAYIFGQDLRDLRSQKRTVDGLNIYDMVYRVAPKHPFWITLMRDFRARVVLFECKNYGKAIGPSQVFTTERYLSSNALRPICFVLTRKPAHPNALQAAFGAMRDSGKLLVFLSDADLSQMLRAKDAQVREGGTAEEMAANDPTEVLDQKIYDFIATIPR